MFSPKSLLAHASVLMLMLVLAIGAERYLGASTDLIRAVPLLYFLYISVFFIVHGYRKEQMRKKGRH
jgi:hypothetical protein